MTPTRQECHFTSLEITLVDCAMVGTQTAGLVAIWVQPKA
jgi:hypothetical protein